MNLREQRLWLEAHPGIPLDETLADFVSFSVEHFADVMHEARVHFQDHHDEAGDGIALDFDFAQYLLMDKLGTLQFVTARAAGNLVGYHSSFISPSLKHRGQLIGSIDMFYLLPVYRSGMTGYKMIVYAVERLIERGVVQIVASVKERHAPMFDRLGFRESERVYVKVI